MSRKKSNENSGLVDGLKLRMVSTQRPECNQRAREREVIGKLQEGGGGMEKKTRLNEKWASPAVIDMGMKPGF